MPGAADMWDLTVSQVHDFAVGNGAFVVHNCGPVNDQALSRDAKSVYKAIGQETNDWKMTVAVADVQDAAGTARRIVTVNESMVRKYGQARLESAARRVLQFDEFYTDTIDRFGYADGHAEGYIAGYLDSHSGSTLGNIGVSHPGGFCNRCYAGLAGRM